MRDQADKLEVEMDLLRTLLTTDKGGISLSIVAVRSLIYSRTP